MSKELQKNTSGISKPSSTVTKTKIGQGLMAGVLAGLNQIELPRMFNQLVIFLLDGSASMMGKGTTGKSKGHEVHLSVIHVLERLAESKNKSSFDIALWAYAIDPIQISPVKAIKEYDLIKDCFNPYEFTSNRGGTYINKTLLEAKAQAEDYLLKYKNQNSKVLIIILGDGAINDYEESLRSKEEISKNPLILFSSILFESTNWIETVDEDILNEIKLSFSLLASTEADYMSTVDAEKIRSHMIQSITRVSNVARA